MCGPPISQSDWIVRRRVKSSRYSSGIFPKSFGSMRSVNCATTPPPLSLLAAELAVLRALYEGRFDHLADIDGLYVRVLRPKDLHGVFELADLDRRVRLGNLVHEEVVRGVQRVLVVELEVLPQHGDGAGLVSLHLRARDDERVDVGLYRVFVRVEVRALHDHPGIRGRKLLAREVDQRGKPGLHELEVLGRVVHPGIDRTVQQIEGPVGVRADRLDEYVFVWIEARVLERGPRRDVTRA